MTAKIIWDAISGFLRSINAVLSIVPGLVWAILLAIAALYGSLMHHERDSAVSEKNVIQASYEQLTAKVIHQKMEATALLKKLTAERDALQAQVNDMRKAQEKKDADNAKLIADQAARLRALAAAAPGGQLRDPNAGRGCGRAGAEGGLPPLPEVVRNTPPKPAGYFQGSLADYSSGSPEKPTTSTPPTNPPAPTR
jgi:hypothetical protein